MYIYIYIHIHIRERERDISFFLCLYIVTFQPSAEALKGCQILNVKASAVSEIMQILHNLRAVTVEYGRQYHKRVTFAMPPVAPYPTDLYVAFSDYDEIVLAMPPDLQIAIGHWAVGQERHELMRRGKATEGAASLVKEIENGKSVVMVSSDGEVCIYDI